MANEIHLPVRCRAYTELVQRKRQWNQQPPKPKPHVPRGPVLAVDTETDTDDAQLLRIITYSIGEQHQDWNGTSGWSVVSVDEGIGYADRFPDIDPDGWAVLQDHIRHEDPQVHFEHAFAAIRINLLTHKQFRDLFRDYAIDIGRGLDGAVVMFNTGFDESRVAVDYVDSNGSMAGGFSFQIWDYPNCRLRHKHLGGGKSLRDITKHNAPDILPIDRDYRGRIIDLREAAQAYTGRSHSLATACKAFKVPGWEDLQEGKDDVKHGLSATHDYFRYARRDSRMYRDRTPFVGPPRVRVGGGYGSRRKVATGAVGSERGRGRQGG